MYSDEKIQELRGEIEELRRQVRRLEQAEAECKRGEEALRKSMDFSQTIINGIGDPTLVIDIHEYRIIMANRAARDHIGVAHLDRKSHTCFESIHKRTSPCKEPDEPCPIRRVVETKSPVRVTHVHRDRKGNKLYVDIMATPILDKSGNVIQIVESSRDITNRVIAEKERERLIQELQEAIAKIKTLKGLLPICAWCHNIRNDKGYWDSLENYIREHSNADFTHSICPECMKKVETEYEEAEGTEE